MAKMNLKRSIAMLLVLNMLTGMIPVQALAEEDEAGKATVVVTITPSESAPAEKQESAPAEKTESAPAEKQESAPAEKTESAPAEKQESAPVEKTESAPAEEIVSAEVASYEDDAAPDAEPDNAPVEPKIESELTTEGGEIEVETEYEKTESEGKNGTTVTTVTVTTTTEGELKGGETITGEETYTETTTTNADGEEIASKAVLEGSETIVDDDPVFEHKVDVKVDLVPGETVRVEESVSSTIVEGKKPAELGKGEYDFTETTLTTERVVEATANENETRVEVEGTSNLTPLIPDRTIVEDKDKLKNDMQLLPEYTYSENVPGSAKDTTAPEGYDFRFASQGQMSKFGNAILVPDGKGGYTEGRTGALQFQLEYDPDYVPGSADNKEITDEDIFLAYCADVDTGGLKNYWYRIDSLEDAGYYDEEAAEYIRAIALNGYWGTSNEPDEDGSLQMGSLAKLKEDMKAALAEGKLAGVTEEDIDSLTEGQALNATQLAIWMFANETTNGSKVDPERMITKGYAKNKGERVDPTEEEIRNARAVFDFLMGLDPIAKGENQEVIDQDAFIKEDSMSIIVGDKTENHENNDDDDDDNDVYNVDLNFALVVTPSADGDDLIVQVVSGFDADGQPIIAAQGRIAGGNAEEDKANGFNDVHYDEETGTYTLTGLSLTENTDYDFDLKLVGTQYLEKGVYVFTSEVRGNTPSQTFVGIAGGDKEVNVTKGFEISFDVSEKSMMVTERHWRKDNDPNNDDRETPPPPAEYRMGFGVGQLEVIEEEVPLAAPPQTGDMSILWFAMIAMSGCGLCILNLLEKRKCRA